MSGANGTSREGRSCDGNSTLTQPSPRGRGIYWLVGWLLMNAVIVSAVRTAVGKAPKGKLSGTRPDDMAAAAIRAAVERVPRLQPAEIDDVYLGCAIPEAEQGMNVARIALLRAGLPPTV